MAKHIICSWINQLFLWPFSQTFSCLPEGHQWIFEAFPFAFPIVFRQVLHGFPWVFPMVFHGFSHDKCHMKVLHLCTASPEPPRQSPPAPSGYCSYGTRRRREDFWEPGDGWIMMDIYYIRLD